MSRASRGQQREAGVGAPLFAYRMRLPDARIEIDHVPEELGGFEGAGYPYCARVVWGKRPSEGGQGGASTSRDPWRACYAAVLKHRRWRERIERAENETGRSRRW